MDKRKIGIVLFFVIFLVYRFIPASGGLTLEQIRAFAMIVLCMVFWFTEFVHLGVSAIFILVLPVIMGIAPMRQVMTSFANPILFFVIANFSMSAALTKVPLAKRILLFLLRLMGRNVSLFTLSLMSATFLVSSVMSNIPATAMFIPIILNFLELYDNETDKKKTGRCMMICLAIAGMVGGTLTPAGSANNLLALSLLEQHTGASVRFLDWIIICAPVALVILPFSWFCAIKIFKPVSIPHDKIENFIKELRKMPPPNLKEVQVGIIFAVLIVLWILSTWFPFLDITIVAVAGMTVMFLPGFDIFSWKEFSKEVSWATVLMIGSVLSVGNVIISTGAAKILGSAFFQLGASVSPGGAIVRLGIYIGVLQVLIPNGPAVIATAAPQVIHSAVEAGINPALLTVALAILSSWTIIIPLSAVPLITYSTGYYKITDIGKVGIPILITVTLVMALWLPMIMS
jgi:sodium-dependent dicarboxylate transporter 2/3/5